MRCKSVIISNGRRLSKTSTVRMMDISLFEVNNPHLKGEAPIKVFEIPSTQVILSGVVVNYLPYGRDLVINDLKAIKVTKKGKIIKITGTQSK